MLSVRHDELQLLESLVTGDSAAWRIFVERYQRVVYARVASTAAETQTAVAVADLEDICAEVFSGLVADNFASLRRFEGRSKLSTWLSVIARRVCLRRILAKAALSNQDDMTEAESPRQEILAQLIAEEDLERMRDCLSRLSESDRQIVKLFFEDNLTYRQIGDRLGLSVNTIGPKLHRAQERLKKLMHQPIPARQEGSNDA